MVAALISALGGIRATVFAGLAATLLAWSLVQTHRVDVAQRALAQHQAEDASASAAAQAKARLTERSLTQAAAEAAAQYEQGKSDAQAAADRVVADLRTEQLRLRARWKCPAAERMPAVAAGASQPDAAAEDRGASAARIVRAASACDAQVAGLQALVRADRAGAP